MDRLIEEYKDSLRDDLERDNYEYPSGLINEAKAGLDAEDFSIPVAKVREMLEQARVYNTETN